MKKYFSASDFVKIKALHEEMDVDQAFNYAIALSAFDKHGIKLTVNSVKNFLVKLNGGRNGERIKLLSDISTGNEIEKDDSSQFKNAIKLNNVEAIYCFTRNDLNTYYENFE